MQILDEAYDADALLALTKTQLKLGRRYCLKERKQTNSLLIFFFHTLNSNRNEAFESISSILNIRSDEWSAYLWYESCAHQKIFSLD